MKKDGRLKWLLIAIPFVFLMALLGLALLIQTDRHHECLRSVLVGLLGKENHFDGELWFSAEATLVGAFISAIPGLMCGLLAYIQTERLHALEDRYHRPSIDLKKAQIRAVSLKQDKSRIEDILGGIPESASICRYGIKEAFGCEYPFYINFRAEFCVKNDIIIKEVNVKQVDFEFSEEFGDEFSDRCWNIALPSDKKELARNRHSTWDFYRGIGNMSCILECGICPPRGTLEGSRAEAFWNAMRDFIFYGSVEDRKHRYMVINLHLNVIYEYGPPKGAEGILYMEFDGKREQGQDRGYFTEASPSNGHFSFDIKQRGI